MLKIRYTTQFKKDYKLALKRGFDSRLLFGVVETLSQQKELPERFRDHNLTNSKRYKSIRECHITPDWLLIYKISKESLLLELIRTGTHSDLF